MTTYPFGTLYHDHIKAKRVVGHPKSNGNITIGNDVWIGSGATIMSGVTVGDGAVIGANSHVVKDVEPYTIVAGNPARMIKQRFESEIIELLLEWRWWEFSAEKIDLISHNLCSTPNVELMRRMIQESSSWERD